MASFCGRFDCLQMLVKHHATVDSVDYDGNTPGASIVFNQVYHTDHSGYFVIVLDPNSVATEREGAAHHPALDLILRFTQI